MIVASDVNALFEDLVGNDVRVWKTIYAFADVEVDPTIMYIVEKIAFLS